MRATLTPQPCLAPHLVVPTEVVRTPFLRLPPCLLGSHAIILLPLSPTPLRPPLTPVAALAPTFPTDVRKA